jgi:hypothetical protein
MQVNLQGNVKPQSQRGRRMQVQNGIAFVAWKLLTTKNGTYFVLVLFISRTLELLEGRNEIEIDKCDSVSAVKGKKLFIGSMVCRNLW